MSLFVYFSLALLFLYLYWPLNDQGKKRVLLLANILFLLILDSYVLVAHFFLTLMNFNLARRVRKWTPIRVTLAVALNLVPLFYQKYRADFSHAYIAYISVSWFTLINLGYLLEVIRQKTSIISRFSDFYLVTGFFPCILMGPIERAEKLLPQLLKPQPLTRSVISEGVWLISLGLFKKMVVADRLLSMCHPGKGFIHQYAGLELWLFYFLCLIHVYCDFSGYIDVARGYARLLGINLSLNFNRPYLARNVANIWQRWNITLVEWLRNHVYVPFLMKTKNIYLASALVMLLVGFWHGPSLMFLLWGLYWSILYSLHIFIRSKGITIFRPVFISIPLMLLAMAFSTVFIHSEDFTQLGKVLARSFSFTLGHRTLWHELQSMNFLIALGGLAIILMAEAFNDHKLARSPMNLFIGAFVLAVGIVALYAPESYLFIYMKF